MRRIYLTGGLGNQLFQLAFALWSANGSELLLDASLGFARKSEIRSLDVSHLSLPSNIVGINYKNPRPTKFWLKFFNLAIRGSNGMQWGFFSGISNSLRRKIALVFLAILYGDQKVKISSEIGYDSSHGRDSEATYIGYFQTYVYASEHKIFEQMSSLFATSLSNKAKELADKALQEKPLIIHIRKGDYLGDELFSKIEPHYYKKAIVNLYDEKSTSPEIWVFSDSTTYLPEYIPNKYLSCAREVDTNGLTAVEILNIMRFGSAYVLANSTFGWWGAFLRIDRASPVIAPKSWFSNGTLPNLIYPADWVVN